MTMTVGKIEQLTHEKAPLPDVARLSPVRSDSLLACTDAMLEAAVNKAVENGLLPKTCFFEIFAENWRRMEECVNAALQANYVSRQKPGAV